MSSDSCPSEGQGGTHHGAREGPTASGVGFPPRDRPAKGAPAHRQAGGDIRPPELDGNFVAVTREQRRIPECAPGSIPTAENLTAEEKHLMVAIVDGGCYWGGSCPLTNLELGLSMGWQGNVGTIESRVRYLLRGRTTKGVFRPGLADSTRAWVTITSDSSVPSGRRIQVSQRYRRWGQAIEPRCIAPDPESARPETSPLLKPEDEIDEPFIPPPDSPAKVAAPRVANDPGEISALADFAERCFPMADFGPKVHSYASMHPVAWIRHALETAHAKGISNWSFVMGVIRRIEDEGGIRKTTFATPKRKETPIPPVFVAPPGYRERYKGGTGKRDVVDSASQHPAPADEETNESPPIPSRCGYDDMKDLLL